MKRSLAGRLTALVLAPVTALGLAACGADRAADGSDPIKVGASLPLTGQFSQPGQAALRGYQTWEALTNERGGLLGRDVELVIKDDASQQNIIVADYNSLISRDKVDLLIGSYSSLLNLPASAIAERNRMLFVEPAGGSPAMFNRGFRYLFYSQQATADKTGLAYANWIADLPKEIRPATAAYPTIDDPFAAPSVEAIRRVLEAAGVRTVYRETYAPDTRNFDTIINAMKASNPQLVVHGASFEDGVGMVRSMLRAGMRPGWLYQTTAPSLGNQYADAIGMQNTEGIAFAISHTPEAKTPGNAEFVAKYQQMFHEPPPEDAADAFAAGQMIEAAVTGVGKIDQTALADWLRNHSVQTVLGRLAWDDDGRPVGEFLIGQWIDGQVQIILPDEYATTDKPVLGWKPLGAKQ
ncbi:MULTISPECIES: amino acid ABC transporter substrate-binding protein [Mycolicibacterium]|uniref:amino acid ABC transporter substrate-binding protein n=1 Tax=Mycolicibacterium TaxID=1866885 RepID=UPI0011D644C3|nr:amino acid ABC transporter substrate-binding protein [Mycolicibacterium mageritense]TXI58292.1 MAG: ABC transporter substrate-binding protein [Mycolicibacterium mageritense]